MLTPTPPFFPAPLGLLLLLLLQALLLASPIFPILTMLLLPPLAATKVYRLISRSRGSQHGSRLFCFVLRSAKSFRRSEDDGVETVEWVSMVWLPSRKTDRETE
ncbi:hypothetical protein M426DRAFT_267038 [Hypoxylon sp. CI-4A]|nr:hypothetical protein M426DRAFT_267038 [Hypoxylon sp. CI-4A]